MFVCKRCGYATAYKSCLITHLKSKTPCKAVNVSIAREDHIKELKGQRNVPDKSYDCDFCGKPFSTSAGKYQHKKRCRSTAKQEHEPVELHDLLEKMSIIETKLTQPTTIINNISNITNYVTTINLQPFNKIDTSYITDTDKFRLCNHFHFDKLYESLREVVRLQYYNDKHPENHTVYIPNVNKNKVRVWNGKEWVVRDKDEVVTNMRNRGIEFMNDYFDENEQLFSMIQRHNCKRLWDKYQSDERVFDKKSKGAVEDCILTYQHIVKQTIDKYNLM